jgi:hypothetical protein
MKKCKRERSGEAGKRESGEVRKQKTLLIKEG